MKSLNSFLLCGLLTFSITTIANEITSGEPKAPTCVLKSHLRKFPFKFASLKTKKLPVENITGCIDLAKQTAEKKFEGTWSISKVTYKYVDSTMSIKGKLKLK